MTLRVVCVIMIYRAPRCPVVHTLYHIRSYLSGWLLLISITKMAQIILLYNKRSAETICFQPTFNTPPKLGTETHLSSITSFRPIKFNTPSKPQMKPCWCRWTRSPRATASCFDIGVPLHDSTTQNVWLIQQHRIEFLVLVLLQHLCSVLRSV